MSDSDGTPSLRDQFARAADLLTFNPGRWNGAAARQDFPEMETQYYRNLRLCRGPGPFDIFYNAETNCYAYALGDRSLMTQRLCAGSNVGSIAGDYINASYDNDFSTKRVSQLAELDGLQPTGDKIEIRPGFRPVALFVCEGEDYHWLRLDKNETGEYGEPYIWSHKFVNRPPRIAVFHDGTPVLDPREASISRDDRRIVRDTDREKSSRYYTFAGFFNVPSDLSIPVGSIRWHQRTIEKVNEPKVAASWRDHLQRMGVPPSGHVSIPQYG